MRITSMSLSNYRPFPSVDATEFGNINLFVGHNNSGKSSILRAIASLQSHLSEYVRDVRHGSRSSTIVIDIKDFNGSVLAGIGSMAGARVIISINSPDRRSGEVGYQIFTPAGNEVASGNDIIFPLVEPHNALITMLSSRKSVPYNSTINEDESKRVASNISNLPAKLVLIGASTHPAHRLYTDACEKILGFNVSAVIGQNGTMVGAYLPDGSALSVEAMGAGVISVVHMLVNLAVGTNKIFLIEEPETDLHPSALRSLLHLISVSSQGNQYFITTHSSTVLSYLGADSAAKIFHVTKEEGGFFSPSNLKEVSRSVTDRADILKDLGYEMSDMYMAEGWIILEEASAQTIIKEFLIPMFTPRLKSFGIVSSGGVTNVETSFEALHKTVLFVHLSPTYKNKVWVRVDGGEREKGIIERLRTSYSGYPIDRFGQFSQEDFERYYPAEFQDKVSDIAKISSKREKRDAKRELLEETIKWLRADGERARAALQQSAQDVIGHLVAIQNEMEQA